MHVLKEGTVFLVVALVKLEIEIRNASSYVWGLLDQYFSLIIALINIFLVYCSRFLNDIESIGWIYYIIRHLNIFVKNAFLFWKGNEGWIKNRFSALNHFDHVTFIFSFKKVWEYIDRSDDSKHLNLFPTNSCRVMQPWVVNLHVKNSFFLF